MVKNINKVKDLRIIINHSSNLKISNHKEKAFKIFNMGMIKSSNKDSNLLLMMKMRNHI